MPKHLVKVASYVEHEGFIYCPEKRSFGEVDIRLPIKCPLCQRELENKRQVKFVLEYDII